MDELEVLRKLSRAARGEEPPRVEVTAEVLRAIARGPERTDPLLLLFAGAAVATAAVFAVLGLQAWRLFSDPCGELLASLTMVMP
jgi:hypothetical protein